MSEDAGRPPLGLRPRYIAAGERAIEILDAIRRYVEAGKPVPGAWLDELRDCLVKSELREAQTPSTASVPKS